jgi:hypothetical protein
MPNAYTSLGRPYGRSLSTSGASHVGFSTARDLCVWRSSVVYITVERPKSATLAIGCGCRSSSDDMNTLGDLRSRWHTAGRRLCRYDMPRAMSSAMRSREVQFSCTRLLDDAGADVDTSSCGSGAMSNSSERPLSVAPLSRRRPSSSAPFSSV